MEPELSRTNSAGSIFRADSFKQRDAPLPPDDPLRAAAAAIRQADALLFATGAGMGVDSGLGTYRGTNAGNFGVDYEEICQPRWFEEPPEGSPELAWGFWSRCFHAYKDSTPHAGYELLCRWGKRASNGCFSLTSNVDGHWLRSGIGEDSVWEVHGSVHHLQDCRYSRFRANERCEVFSEDVWTADPAVMAAMTPPAWDLRPGQPVQVKLTLDADWSDAVVAPDSKALLSSEGKELASVYGLRDASGGSAAATQTETLDILRVSPDSPWPRCLDNDNPARPNILMFNDGYFNPSRTDAQQQLYNGWSESLPPDTKLVVVEIGVGTVVSCRHPT